VVNSNDIERGAEVLCSDGVLKKHCANLITVGHLENEKQQHSGSWENVDARLVNESL
jgi:hypothetical protein